MIVDHRHADAPFTSAALQAADAQLRVWTASLERTSAAVVATYNGDCPDLAGLVLLLPAVTTRTSCNLTAYPQAVLEQVLSAERSYQLVLSNVIAHLEAQRQASAQRYRAAWYAWYRQYEEAAMDAAVGVPDQVDGD